MFSIIFASNRYPERKQVGYHASSYSYNYNKKTLSFYNDDTSSTVDIALFNDGDCINIYTGGTRIFSDQIDLG